MKEKEQLRSLWQERVKEFKSSGLSMKKWCDDHELKVHQLQYWLKKYSTTSSNTSNNWVEIDLTTSTILKETNSSPIQLKIGQCQIDINSGFDPNTLKDVIKVLSELC